MVYCVMLLRCIGPNENWATATEFYNTRPSATLTKVLIGSGGIKTHGSKFC